MNLQGTNRVKIKLGKKLRGLLSSCLLIMQTTHPLFSNIISMQKVIRNSSHKILKSINFNHSFIFDIFLGFKISVNREWWTSWMLLQPDHFDCLYQAFSDIVSHLLKDAQGSIQITNTVFILFFLECFCFHTCNSVKFKDVYFSFNQYMSTLDRFKAMKINKNTIGGR